MTVYYRCNMKMYQHVIAYIVCSIICAVLVYIFYHLTFLSVVLGLIMGIYLEKMFAASTVRKRQKNLRLQFRAFLESMSVACRSGQTEVQALSSALEDLKITFRYDADIVLEVENIIKQYKNGGISIPLLFNDFADRSDLEDVRSFATIYSVISGKNDRIGDILTETSEIIGDKIEIEHEIETTITSAKGETNMMLVLPIIMVLAMSAMGGGLLDTLFTTTKGHIAATVALVMFAISYVFAVKVTDIDV